MRLVILLKNRYFPIYEHSKTEDIDIGAFLSKTMTSFYRIEGTK